MPDAMQARLRAHALPKRGTVVGDYLEDAADRIDALEAALRGIRDIYLIGGDTEEQLRWAEMTAHNALAPAGGAEGREG